MEVQYKITEADYVQSVKLAATATRKQLVLMGAGGFGLLLIGLFGQDSLKVLGYAGLICGVLGYFVVLHLFSPLQARRHYRNYPSIHTPLYLELAEGGFTVRTEHGQNAVRWEKLLKWRENKDYLLVYFAPKMFYLFPKRITDLGFDMEEFRKSLREKLGDPI